MFPNLRSHYQNVPSARVSVPNDDLIAWLADQTPDTWHTVASGWNYDTEPTPLLWIARQERCDKATAANLFFTDACDWLSYPSIEVVPPCYRAAWSVCKEVADRWSAGFYSRSQLRTRDLRHEIICYLRIVVTMQAKGEPIPFGIPDEAYGLHRGREAISDYTSSDSHIFYSFDAWRRQRLREGGWTAMKLRLGLITAR